MRRGALALWMAFFLMTEHGWRIVAYANHSSAASDRTRGELAHLPVLLYWSHQAFRSKVNWGFRG